MCRITAWCIPKPLVLPPLLAAPLVPLRNMGVLSPFNAFLIMQGMETLSLRMERHCDNRENLLSFCKRTTGEWVQYAGLPNHPDHALAREYMGGKPSSIMCFGNKGGQAAGAKFIDALAVFTDW